MSTFAIVVIVVGALLLLFLAGGFAASRRRANAPDYAEHVADADQALEAARAADRGWDRELLERAAREAITAERPEFAIAELHLVLVDDRPGVAEDRAHLVATGGAGELRVVLTRREAGDWYAESVD